MRPLTALTENPERPSSIKTYEFSSSIVCLLRLPVSRTLGLSDKFRLAHSRVSPQVQALPLRKKCYNKRAAYVIHWDRLQSSSRVLSKASLYLRFPHKPEQTANNASFASLDSPACLFHEARQPSPTPTPSLQSPSQVSLFKLASPLICLQCMIPNRTIPNEHSRTATQTARRTGLPSTITPANRTIKEHAFWLASHGPILEIETEVPPLREEEKG